MNLLKLISCCSFKHCSSFFILKFFWPFHPLLMGPSSLLFISCYLSLGEIENASLHFVKCLQAKNDACADRKVLLEASEGLERVQVIRYTHFISLISLMFSSISIWVWSLMGACWNISLSIRYGFELLLIIAIKWTCYVHKCRRIWLYHATLALTSNCPTV